MSGFTRRAGAAIALTALTSVAGALGATSAAAAEPYPGCTEPIDGAVLCYNASKSPTNPVAYASLALQDPDRTFAGALVVLERCNDEGCTPVRVETGSNTNSVGTDLFGTGGPGDWDWRAKASWVDDHGNHHTGVVAQY